MALNSVQLIALGFSFPSGSGGGGTGGGGYFASRYFAPRYFAARYWNHETAAVVVPRGPNPFRTQSVAMDAAGNNTLPATFRTRSELI